MSEYPYYITIKFGNGHDIEVKSSELDGASKLDVIRSTAQALSGILDKAVANDSQRAVAIMIINEILEERQEPA